MSFTQMLTGDEGISSGDACIGGYSVLSQLDDARQNLGKTGKMFNKNKLV